MNRTQLVSCGFKAMLILIVFFGKGSYVNAKDQGCWADFFEGTQYKGKHFLLEGSTQLADLGNVDKENWNLRISSIKVGPKAKVTTFEYTGFELKPTEETMSPDAMRSWGITAKDVKEDSELIFNANAMIHDLNDFHFRQKIKSLKVECIK